MTSKALALSICLCAAAGAAVAAVVTMPLSEVRAGQHGIGKTVFTGDRVEDFDVEILGVLRNTGPRESLILARLSGGPLEHTGVMQGMSGSPVYIDGRLIGAVAVGFPFAKDPIAGIRPIEEMLRAGDAPSPRAQLNGLPPREPAPFGDQRPGDQRPIDIATPLSLSGFTPAAVERFGAGLRALGLEPRQGISLGGAPEDRMGDPALLKPGSMITVALMTGDMSVGADGTLTCIDGNRVYAFGHRFLAVGPTELPFTRSEVMTLLANVNSSFKISSAQELMGVITQDRDTAIAGNLGRRAAMLPLDISVAQDGRAADRYRMQMVNDRFLSPYLLQMAVFSALDSTVRSTGATTVAVHGTIEFENRKDVAEIRNIYAVDSGAPTQAATNTALPLSYLMQTDFDGLRVRHISIELDTASVKKDLNISQVYLSRREAKPGDTVELMTVLDGANGVAITRSVKYQIPAGIAPGTLYFTVADGNSTSLGELRQVVNETPHSPEKLISTVNRLRPNDHAWVRVWRSDAAYEVQGEELSDPPPSLALVLGNAQSFTQNRNSKLAEFSIDGGGRMVSGSKTVQIEVKE